MSHAPIVRRHELQLACHAPNAHRSWDMQSNDPETLEPADKVTVPEGFAVRYWKLPPAGGVIEIPGSVLVGHFGYVGGEFESTQAVFDTMLDYHSRERRTPRVCTMIDEEISIGECFDGWDMVETRDVADGIVWTAYGDGLSWLLADRELRARFLSGFRNFRGQPQWLVMQCAPPPDLRALLQDVGVDLRFATPQHHFMVQILGPDARMLTAVLNGVPSIPWDVASLAKRPMLSASRLISALESLMARGKLAAAFDVLLAHPAAFVLRSDSAGRIAPMQFPTAHEPMLPIYLDIATWMRADRELRTDDEPRGIAQFEPHKLMTWARDLGCGLAIGWYDSAQTPMKYLLIPRMDLEILCNGALTRSYSFSDQVRMMFGLRPSARPSDHR